MKKDKLFFISFEYTLLTPFLKQVFKSGVNRVCLKDMLQQMKQITDVDQMVWILTLDEIAPLQTMDD